MRVGSNPLRNAKASEFAPVVLCVVTHLPNFEGYHEHRLEVVQTCLRTMTANAGVEYSLVVWDNASCSEFREWVQDEVKPDVFVQSFNAGKTAGRTSITRMIPPGRVVCYSDDDMLYYPNWLRPQMGILGHFPNVSCVTGYPVRTQFRWGNTKTKNWARTTQGAKLEMGRFIPQEWEDDFAVSIGRDPGWHAEYTRNDSDARITYNGKQAYATSHHCQFIAKSEVIGRILSFDGMAMGDEKVMDDVLDQLGLRLATTDRLCRHIGNVIHDELRREIEAMRMTA
jgi:hypothetical protein